jgi:glycerol kinase
MTLPTTLPTIRAASRTVGESLSRGGGGRRDHPDRPPTLAAVSVVIAIDAGTTGVRAIAFDEGGRTRHTSYRELTQHFPRPGWVEHDADEIWDGVQAVLGEVAEACRGDGEAVAALGITDQRETVVVWDRASGRPLHRAIVWQDRRTAQRCQVLADGGYLPLVRSTSGLVLDPYFSGSKLEWLFTEGGVTAGTDVAAGTIDSWLIWKLTDGVVHATDTTNASRTMLFDIRSGAWSPELCDLFGVPAHVLPEVRPSSGRFGLTAPTAACGPGVAISGVAGDQQAALFGQACFAPGTAKNTFGTGSFVLMNVGERCPDPVEGLLTTVAWTVPRGDGTVETTYALEGSIFVTGAAVQWLRDGLGIIESSPDVGPLAETVPDSGGAIVVPAFTGLGSPWWDPYARGTVLGITRGTTRAHLARAVLEAMAFQTRDVVDAMVAASGQPLACLRADGGAATDLVLQMVADQLQVPVARPVEQQTTALGAAYLAGLAEGVWGSFDDITANWGLDVECAPEEDTALADAAHQRWSRAVERSRHWDR